MLALPHWLHELATFATLALAGAWLVLHVRRISRPRASGGCARCTQDPALPQPASRGLRSKRLRVLG